MLVRSLSSICQNYLKIVLAGDQAVGKTSIRKRYMGEAFNGRYMLTIGAEFSLKKIRFNGTEMNLQIWDLAGQQQFRAVRTLYYNGAKGIILVYDVTNRKTFNNLQAWIDEFIQHNNNQLVPILLIGNKIDLREQLTSQCDHITTAEGIEKSKQLEETYSQKGFDAAITFHEASAKAGIGIEKAMNEFLINMTQARKKGC